MKIAMYAGSFDPITKGHEDIINRALVLFDKVIIAIGFNPAKKGYIEPYQREGIISSIFAKEIEENRIEVKSFSNCLTVELAKSMGANVLIRGIRNQKDLEEEKSLFRFNKELEQDIETVYLFSPAELEHVSSSAVKMLIASSSHGWAKRIHKYVSPEVVRYMIALSEKCYYDIKDNVLNRYRNNDKAVNLYEEHDVYHNIIHINKMLNWADCFGVSNKQLQYEIFFHDYYYNPIPSYKGENEDKSAAFLREAMQGNFSEEEINNSVISVLNTKHENGPKISNPDKRLYLLSDLNLLGFALEYNFDSIMKRIKKEYKNIPDAMFYQGRVAFLESFVNSRDFSIDSSSDTLPPIYVNDIFKQFAPIALKNILSEIEYLKKLC